MKRISRTRAIGLWGAWPAALALLLNAVLTSSLLAAVPAFDSFGQALICHASGFDGPVAGDPNDANTPGAAHCKLCVPAIAAPPPPLRSDVAFHRVAVSEVRDPPFETPLKASPRAADYESRGPPRRT